jgi:hypothetical protein
MLEEPFSHARLQSVSLLDRGDIVFVERCADEQAHSSAILNQTRNARRGNRKRSRTEKSRATIVPHAGRERGDVEIVEWIVGGTVKDAEGVIAKHHLLGSPENSL